MPTCTSIPFPYNCVSHPSPGGSRDRNAEQTNLATAGADSQLGLHRLYVYTCICIYKILSPFKALLCESIILLCLPPPAAHPIGILMHDHRATYAPPPTPPLYAIYHTILVMAISCKGQHVCVHSLHLQSCVTSFSRPQSRPKCRPIEYRFSRG